VVTGWRVLAGGQGAPVLPWESDRRVSMAAAGRRRKLSPYLQIILTKIHLSTMFRCKINIENLI